MKEMETLHYEYYHWLNKQQFFPEELDYSIFEKQKPLLNQMARINNSGITVFDMYKKEHIYTSYNFTEILGYDLDSIQSLGNDYFNQRIHPDDMIELLKNGIRIIQLYFQLPLNERPFYKFVTEYRVLGIDGNYVRVIEQQQSLETDARGNIWLALGILDLSPDQSNFTGIKSHMYNFKTGEFLLKFPDFQTQSPPLSKREKEILKLVKAGMLSKEISDMLSISVHTVNTHRQRILEKLGANNSMEASSFASRLGIV
ncbi:MAG TPA: LuxR C-terminal-related transcriptional regulator [Saprospiraceae bacterium]|nr:LuxR C-terminal-related transcriptional regulator [Saprospiraceae bacterium]